MTDDQPHEPIPSRLGRYEVQGILGRGGMGVVLRGVDPALGRTVALKVLRQERATSNGIERFRREARAAAGLRHPNIVVVHDFGEEGADSWIAMELLVGETVQEMLARLGRLPVRRAIEIAIAACHALEHAHARGIVHRDVKPGNVHVGADGVVKLMDFGVAKILEGDAEAVTRTGAVPGSPAYMSPEQAMGEAVDARTDVWAVGILLREMLCGENPYRASTVAATLTRILHEPLPPFAASCPDLPPSLLHAVDRAHAHAPADRYPSAAALAAALEASLADLGGLAGQATVTSHARVSAVARSRRMRNARRSALWAIGAVAAVAVISAPMWWPAGDDATREAAAPAPTSAPSVVPPGPPMLSEDSVTLTRGGRHLEIRDAGERLVVEWGLAGRVLPGFGGDATKLPLYSDVTADGIADLVILTTPERPLPGRAAHDPEVHVLDGRSGAWLLHDALQLAAPDGIPDTCTSRFTAFAVVPLPGPSPTGPTFMVGMRHDEVGCAPLVFYDSSMRRRGTFWTWGHPKSVLVGRDLSSDPGLEIILGVRDASSLPAGAALLLLDPDHADGVSPVIDGSLPSSGFLGMIKLPVTPLTFGGVHNQVEELTLDGDARLRIHVNEGESPAAGTVFYTLDPALRLVDVGGGSAFRRFVEELAEREGRTFSWDALTADLKAQVRYFHHGGWTSEPPALPIDAP